jgi:hypothetical protein
MQLLERGSRQQQEKEYRLLFPYHAYLLSNERVIGHFQLQ